MNFWLLMSGLAALMLGMAPIAAMGAVQTQPITLEHAGKTYKGVVAFDNASSGKRPGVLVIHEWWGCNDYAQGRAKMLAEMGYLAIAVDMYGDGKTTTNAEEAGKLSGAVYADPQAMRALISAWLGALKARAEVDASRTAAIGYCFGGSTALELARSGADVRACVSFHGNLATKNPAQPGGVKARVLACNGADDPFVAPVDRAAFVKEMSDAKADFQFVEYGGAVHSFTNPGVDAFNIPGARYEAKADRRSWAAMKALFDEAFAK